MDVGLRPLRVNALELLRQPGTTRSIAVEIESAALELDHDDLDGDVSVDTARNNAVPFLRPALEEAVPGAEWEAKTR